MKKIIILTLIYLSFAVGRGWAQSDTLLVAKNLELARQLMDRGLYDESIALLDDADKLDSARTALYAYEKAFAYYLKEDYKTAIKLLKKAAGFRDASDSVYQMLADCYIITGDLDMALKTYHRGLKEIPYSGRLYYGVGVIHFSTNEIDLARDSFLAGIERDPGYASNWFSAAAIYLASGDKAFGMVNGETAVCLEPDSPRSENMSKALIEAYRENISFPGDTTVQVSFASIGSVLFGETSDGHIPFPLVYEVLLKLAVGGERALDTPSLIRIRRRFIELWFSEGATVTHKAYYVPLFDYHRAIIEAGHFEAYNYWLFSTADRAGFEAWRLRNGEAFEAFTKWFNQNSILEP